MSPYLYDDEDNAPMTDDAWDGPHNPTVYGSRAEMKAAERDLPFSDPPENCHEYCPYARRCRYADGVPGLEPENCDMFYNLDKVIKEEKHRG